MMKKKQGQWLVVLVIINQFLMAAFSLLPFEEVAEIFWGLRLFLYPAAFPSVSQGKAKVKAWLNTRWFATRTSSSSSSQSNIVATKPCTVSYKANQWLYSLHWPCFWLMLSKLNETSEHIYLLIHLEWN